MPAHSTSAIATQNMGPMSGARWRWSTLGVAVVALLAVLPFVVPSLFYLHIINITAINAIIVLGLWLTFAVGQLSLSHSAFAGFAGYASALLTLKLGLPALVSLAIAVALAGIFAWAIGRIILRLRGVFFVLVTFLIGQMFVLIALNWTSLTNGANGLVNIAPIRLFGLNSASRLEFYFMVIPALLLIFGLALWIERSNLGKAFNSISEDLDLSESIGIDTARYQTLAFCLGSMIAAFGGSLFAHYIRFLAPDTFTFHFSVALITMLVVGGRKLAAGALIGAVFVTPLPEFLRSLDWLQHIVYGLVLIAVLLFMPNGIVGVFKKGLKRW